MDFFRSIAVFAFSLMLCIPAEVAKAEQPRLQTSEIGEASPAKSLTELTGFWVSNVGDRLVVSNADAEGKFSVGKIEYDSVTQRHEVIDFQLVVRRLGRHQLALVRFQENEPFYIGLMRMKRQNELQVFKARDVSNSGARPSLDSMESRILRKASEVFDLDDPINFTRLVEETTKADSDGE